MDFLAFYCIVGLKLGYQFQQYVKDAKMYSSYEFKLSIARASITGKNYSVHWQLIINRAFTNFNFFKVQNF